MSSPLLHSKDFTKNDQTDQVYNTCSQQEHIAPRSKPLLNLQQTKKPHNVHCVFQEHLCWNLQQVTVIHNPLYNLETPYCSPQQTTAEPTADQETTQNSLCVSRTPLLKPTTTQLYRIHCITKKRLTLLSTAGKPPVQTHCTMNYTPVIQEHSSSFNTIERFTQKSTNKSNSIQQIRNIRGNRYRVLRLRSDQWCRNVQSVSKLQQNAEIQFLMNSLKTSNLSSSQKVWQRFLLLVKS